MKIRFAVNQVGLAIEYYAHGQWRCSGFYNHSKVAEHGGLQALKTKALYALYPAMNMQQEIIPAGDYTENGITITCI